MASSTISSPSMMFDYMSVHHKPTLSHKGLLILQLLSPRIDKLEYDYFTHNPCSELEFMALVAHSTTIATMVVFGSSKIMS